MFKKNLELNEPVFRHVCRQVCRRVCRHAMHNLSRFDFGGYQISKVSNLQIIKYCEYSTFKLGLKIWSGFEYTIFEA